MFPVKNLCPGQYVLDGDFQRIRGFTWIFVAHSGAVGEMTPISLAANCSDPSSRTSRIHKVRCEWIKKPSRRYRLSWVWTVEIETSQHLYAVVFCLDRGIILLLRKSVPSNARKHHIYFFTNVWFVVFDIDLERQLTRRRLDETCFQLGACSTLTLAHELNHYLASEYRKNKASHRRSIQQKTMAYLSDMVTSSVGHHTGKEGRQNFEDIKSLPEEPIGDIDVEGMIWQGAGKLFWVRPDLSCLTRCIVPLNTVVHESK